MLKRIRLARAVKEDPQTDTVTLTLTKLGMAILPTSVHPTLDPRYPVRDIEGLGGMVLKPGKLGLQVMLSDNTLRPRVSEWRSGVKKTLNPELEGVLAGFSKGGVKPLTINVEWVSKRKAKAKSVMLDFKSLVISEFQRVLEYLPCGNYEIYQQFDEEKPLVVVKFIF